MKHPPYPWWHYVSDVVWTSSWFLAAVIAVFSPERRYWIVSLLIILCLAMRHYFFGGELVPFYMLILFSAYGWIRRLRS